MPYINFIKDKNGNVVYPITIAKAVIDHETNKNITEIFATKEELEKDTKKIPFVNGSDDAIDIDVVDQPNYGTIAIWLNGSEADGPLPGNGTNSGIILQHRWRDSSNGSYVDCMSQVAFTKNGVYYRAVEDYDTSAQMDLQGWDKLAIKSDIYQEVTITQFDESGLKINITGLTAAKLNAGVPIMAKGNGVSISIQYQYYGGTLYMMCTAWETSYDEINVYTCTTTSLSGVKTFAIKNTH